MSWSPTIHPGIDQKLAAAEAALAAGEASQAQLQFAAVLQILEDDDPVDPSFNKAYVMSRRALARAHQKQADALDEVTRCRNYLGQWDAPDGLFWLSVNLTAGQILRLLGHEDAARRDLQKLWGWLRAARDQSASVAALQRETAAELAGLGAAVAEGEIPPLVTPPLVKGPPALVDYRFEPRFAHRLHIVPVKQGANTYSGADGSVAWFNPRSGSDVKLLMGAATGVLETDDPAVLGRLEPSDECVFYQPWREPVEGGTVRLVGATVADMLVPAGQRLAGSGVRHLFLVTGGVFRGALGAFHQALAGHPLETFGIVWHFTGDDISDVPTMVEEIAGLAAACAVRKLSLVTTAFTSRIEKQMVECFGRVPSLRECSVWEKDKASKYPRYPSPLLDALLAARV